MQPTSVSYLIAGERRKQSLYMTIKLALFFQTVMVAYQLLLMKQLFSLNVLLFYKMYGIHLSVIRYIQYIITGL